MSAFSRLRGLTVLIAFISPMLYGAPLNNPDYRSFEKIFNDWTDAFNHKNLSHVCQLYSDNSVMDHQGQPRKNYKEICQNFESRFNEKNRSYQYHFTLHDVYRSADLACARITWYLRIVEKDKLVAAKQDEDFALFKQDSKGQWKIINSIGYPTTKE